MIKPTFYNLSDDRKIEFINIAKKEFASHPIDEITVKNIASSLGIARSSFYNYFDSVDDLFNYLLNDYKKKIFVKFKLSLEYNNGDVFKMTNDLFSYIIDNEEMDFYVLRNIFLNTNPLVHNKVLPHEKENKDVLGIKCLMENVDWSNLNIDNSIILIEVLLDILTENIIHFFMEDMDKDKAKEWFNQKINIIKYGVCKE